MATDPTRHGWHEPVDPVGRDRAVFVISVAAELSGVHPQTLRVYERKGLLTPARTGGMSRRYSEAEIDRVKRIQELTTAGLNLAGVKRVLEMEAEISWLRFEMQKLRAAAGSTGHALVPLHQDLLPYQGGRNRR